MKDAKLYIVVAGIIVMIAFFIPLFGTYATIPHGYDGIVAGSYDIEHSYDKYDTYNLLYWSGIDPYTTYYTLTGAERTAPAQTGVRIQISSPQYVSSDDYDPVEKVEPYDTENELVTEQRAAIYEFEMSVNIQTYGDGMEAIENVVFWTDLKNNDYTIFTDPNDVAVAILNVVTKDYEVMQEAGGIEVDPEGIGFDAPLVTIDGSAAEVPDYVGDIVNIDSFKLLTHVKFPIVVNYAKPTIRSPIDWSRVEAQVFLQFSIDVFVIGEWQQLRPIHTVIPPDPDLTWWDILVLAIADIWDGLMAPLGAIVVIIAIIGTVVILIKGQGIIRVVGIIGLWIAVLFVLSMIGIGVMVP